MSDLAPLLDDELIIATLLKRDLPTVTVAAELDFDSINEVPMVMFMATSGDQARNGPGLWASTLTIDVFATDPNLGWDVCTWTYQAVHAWSDPGQSNLPWGYVSRVTDLSSFTRVTTQQMQGKNVTQFTALFDLMLRNK